MSRAHNFGAGPCTLPLSVLEQAAGEFVDFGGEGMSLIEMSHRSKTYDKVHMETMDLMRELLGLPDDYKVLLLGGGATMQFGMLPMNFLPDGGFAEYVVSGSWGKKAFADGKKIGDARAIWDGADDNYTTLPDPAKLNADPGAAYLHITSNETIGGIQWKDFPDTDSTPLVCDTSSDFLSRPIPVEKFDMLYAGAQKNAGPAGSTVVIIKEELLEKVCREVPAYLDYRIHASKDSLYNTPPVFPIYMMGLVLKQLKADGGLAAAQAKAAERAGIVYGAMDASGGYYRCPIPAEYRSPMNVVFRLPDEDLEKQFIAEATAAGLIGLKGHRSVGGCRASLYNAMPIEGAQALADFMGEFAKKNG